VTSEGSVSLAAKDAVDVRLSSLHLTSASHFERLLIFGEDVALSRLSAPDRDFPYHDLSCYCSAFLQDRLNNPLYNSYIPVIF
jgi:hypothetical protein